VAQNLELKARCRSLSAASRIARSLGARAKGVLSQTDTYLGVPTGRLKLREMRGRSSELIFYDRPSSDSKSGRWSSYIVYPLRSAKSLRSSLSAAWPVRAVVRKRRRLFVLENARIHLDDVDRLGSFIEFEVMLTQGKGPSAALFRHLRESFGIRRKDLIAGSYADMLHPLRHR
jgi:adenylate cyclase class IV